MRKPVTVALMGSLTACGGGGGDQQQAAATNDPQIAIRSAEQDALHNLSDQNRDIGLKRAILASGMRCQRVTRSGYVAEYNKLSMWTANCDDKRDWAIFVGPDGSAQVRPCQDMATLKLPECLMAADPSGRTARGLGQQAGS
jgi:hypothetical protein